ncbi:MAG: acyltransferase [Elusimicrobia bacterium]|nr:acyltransferase [Elusimicrobiota bacterium]
MRLGVVQNHPKFLKAPGNLKACLELMDKHEADLWVLPELFASGYAFKTKAEAARCAERADGPLASLLKAYAAQRGCAIVAGFPEKAGARLYNSAMLVTAAKTRVYRKTHIFGGEKRFFAPGDTGLWVEDVAGAKVGVMICFDWFFPEAARTLALRGAQVIAHPSNLVLPWAPEGMKIRSLENRVFSATANRVGAERGLRFIGQSQIVSPNGSLLARLGHEETRAAVVAVDAWTAKDKKVHPANDLFADRRPSLYGLAKA